MTEIETYYEAQRPLTTSQKKYVLLLEKVFNVFSMRENAFIPYKTVPWQQEFHAYSLNALQKQYWKDKLVVKGRGISFSVSSMIDLVMSASKFKNLVIPVVTHRIENAYDLVKIAQTLVDNANIKFNVERPFIKGELAFNDTGSVIRAYPSSNVNALRLLRTFTGLLDEISFYRDIKGLLDAAESITSEGGQLILGSTVYDRTNYFWELFEKQKQLNNKYVFYLPLFDPLKFNPNQNILDQVKAGLKPLVWWQDLGRLEDKRARDIHSFMRENQCSPVDEGVNFLSIEKILRNVDNKLRNFDVYSSDNMLIAGVDIASYQDYIAIVIFEITSFGAVMRHMSVVKKGMELPDLQRLLEVEYMEKWDLTKMRIDMTGMGTQISQYMKRKYGGKIEPIHFGESVGDKLTGGQSLTIHGIRERVRDKMAWNMRQMFEDDSIKILDDGLLMRHLNGWSYDLKKCLCSEGHGDLFWACAMALLPLNYKRGGGTKLNIVSSGDNKFIDHDKLQEVEVVWQ
jgi:phage FluMu gp28-like protein